MSHAVITAATLLAAMVVSGGPASADTIFDVEHARAKERAGRYLNDQDVEALDRWGGESRWRRGYYGYYDGPAYGYDGYYAPPPRRYYRRWRD